MTTDPGEQTSDIEVQVLTDQAGRYYLVPRELAEDLRVPEELSVTV